MVAFAEYIIKHWQIPCIFVVIGGLMAYLAYGLGVFDQIPWTPPLGQVASITLKWLITPSLIVMGLLSLLVLLLLAGGKRPPE